MTGDLHAALRAERPLQVPGVINAYAAMQAQVAGSGRSICPAPAWPTPGSRCPIWR